MKVALFYHSILADWNNSSAHFLRGVATELASLGHEVRIFEPANAWSYRNLVESRGEEPLRQFRERYPLLESTRYDSRQLDLDAALNGIDLVLVHDTNDAALVAQIGNHRSTRRDLVALFHDTHHRMVTAPEQMRRYDLSSYDGVLACGRVLRDLYISRDWAARAWTWHEAADTRVFTPQPSSKVEGDLVWVGNWGEGERTDELYEYLINPIRDLGLRAKFHGVRYPDSALAKLAEAHIDYEDWLPNFRVPEIFSKFRVTVHVPRRPYAKALPGIPSIRIFEALACGIPLVCAPWIDSEGLFTPGRDYLVAHSGFEMQRRLWELLSDEARAEEIRRNGLKTIQERHTCRHRAQELLEIYTQVAPSKAELVR